MTATSQPAIPPSGREIQTSEALARHLDRIGQGEIEISKRAKSFTPSSGRRWAAIAVLPRQLS